MGEQVTPMGTLTPPRTTPKRPRRVAIAELSEDWTLLQHWTGLTTTASERLTAREWIRHLPSVALAGGGCVVGSSKDSQGGDGEDLGEHVVGEWLVGLVGELA